MSSKPSCIKDSSCLPLITPKTHSVASFAWASPNFSQVYCATVYQTPVCQEECTEGHLVKREQNLNQRDLKTAVKYQVSVSGDWA